MDFYRIAERPGKRKGEIDVFPDFKVVRSKDLMVRGRAFYAIWDEEKGLWSTDEYDVQRLIDDEIRMYEKQMGPRGDAVVNCKYLGSFSSNTWLTFRNYVGHISDSSQQLDENLTFSNTEVKKEDYVSRRLPYPLEEGDYSAWDELVGRLYEPEERAKIEWAIGAIVAGDAKKIQKFLVFYGDPGSGKGTIMKVVAKLFQGYYTMFDAKALTGSGNSFSTEVFKENPLVGIQEDGDLSKIEDNTKLNSIISHEEMVINEKFKPQYTTRINAFLFLGSNKPVKITDGKSGLIRRLIDVYPSGKLFPPKHYHALMSQIDFQLAGIAWHCLQVYREMGKDYYSGYRPVSMMMKTDVFFNFIEAYYDIFKGQDGITLKQAYEMYKSYCDDANVEFRLPLYKFREELKNYYEDFVDRADIDDVRVRSWFSGFKADRFKIQIKPDEHAFSLVMDETESILDELLADMPAQYGNTQETPIARWANVTTSLKDIDTKQLHYVKVPKNHIVIDFDLKDDDGNKSLERNLEAASQWPPTYAEASKGGNGIHLHYNYDGDVDALSRVFEEGIEIKVFVGDSSLRRRLSRCNNVPVASINSGLPLREKKMLDQETVKSEKGLRDLIERNLRKEIHPGTKPSVDFIHKILDDAYKSGMTYDVTDMRGRILTFAAMSSHQSLACIKLVQTMQFKSEDVIEAAKVTPEDERFAIFDVEVYPNLFVLCWKYAGCPKESTVKLINPTPQQIEEVMALKLIGFNCRRYDNHIIYGAFMGLNNEQLYNLSQKLISNDRSGYFAMAYNISYADIYDFSSVKQSLKKFQLDLGLHHQEMELPWDEPVPEELWDQVVAYCVNDVDTTDAVFEDRKGDFIARQILADLSGLAINATTQQHAARIIFGEDKHPQEKFVYTNLSEEFPGYTFDMGKSEYRGEITGEGGYVYAEPGMYENVALLDVASMHPTSIEQLNLFGEYTQTFSELKAARIAIKHGDFEAARRMMGGKLARHLEEEDIADQLSYALKIVINIVYGLTAAKFDNAFRDPRNIDNIVAKRGALFMIELKHYLQSKGVQVVHIKTDSIKIPNATPELIDEVMEFGLNYGYEFEHEETYEKFCLVNDAVYIAKTKQGKKPAHWTATGAQFANPYVFKTMFSHEPVKFDDLCETKQVTTALYLDFDYDTPMAFDKKPPMFVGRAGRFCPIQEGKGGGLLVREKEGQFYAAGGTKGYFWLEAEMVKRLKKEKDVDMRYFEALVYDARQQLEKFGDAEWFMA